MTFYSPNLTKIFKFTLLIIPLFLFILSPLSCSKENHKALPPWPRWAFSHWLWEGEEDERGTQEALMELIKGYRSRDIPVGVFVIDSPWETCYNTLEFDRNLFPDPKGFIDELHSMGIRVGDQDATFDGIKAALDNMYHSSLLGYVAFGSDIGGYRDDDEMKLGRTKELFIRWVQLGAFCPVMENGGGGEHRPWMFDQETNDIYRLFTRMHYSLIDYLMEQGASAWDRNESLMTFLNKSDYTYLLGSDILVAPMIESGTSRTVNFPPSEDWIYLLRYDELYTAHEEYLIPR